MRNATMGLKSLLHAIPSKNLIRQIYEKYAPSVTVDWSTGKQKLDEALAVATTDLKKTSYAEWNGLTSRLDEVCLICDDRKTPERLVAATQATPISERDKGLSCEEKGPLQNGVCWLLLNAPETWQRLLTAARAVRIRTKNSQRFTVTSSEQPDNTRLNELESEISALLFNSLGHGDRTHLEAIDDGECWRYFMSVNKYPVNVQHFDDEGRYAIAHDKTAENFLIEYSPATSSLLIRCDYAIAIRRSIAESFSRLILNARTIEREKRSFDLSRHLLGIEPKPLVASADYAILGASCIGLSVSYRNGEGSFDTLSLVTDGSTDIRKQLQKALYALAVPETDREVTEVTYRLNVKTAAGQRDIEAVMRQDGFRVNVRDRKLANIAENYMMGTIA